MRRSKSIETLLPVYGFPAEHWKHLRTTNPIESTFATARHRTIPPSDEIVSCDTSSKWPRGEKRAWN
jgi:transposase-like protein